MNYQWYPGHMTKARRMMQEDIRLTDLVLEIADARIPVSSRNPDIDQMAKGKERLLILNKADLADPVWNEKWMDFYKQRGIRAVLMDSRSRKGVAGVRAEILRACSAKVERDRKRGIKNRPVRMFIAGIPNVGKSTFINDFTGKSGAKTGNRPGVTRGDQWIHMNGNMDLLDTPGILWPKFEDETVGLHLAMVGTINDEIIDFTDLASEIIRFYKGNYTDIFISRYDIIDINADVPDILDQIADSRKCVKPGGEPDIQKAASILLGDFRSGQIGRITIERP